MKTYLYNSLANNGSGPQCLRGPSLWMPLAWITRRI